MQDAYVKFLEKQPQFQDGEHARAWLLKVTANGCKSRLRARKRHPVAELLDTYPAPEGDSRELVEAILSLPANQRAAVHLHYYEGYSPGRSRPSWASGRGRCAPISAGPGRPCGPI